MSNNFAASAGASGSPTAVPFQELAFSTYHEVIAAELRCSIFHYNNIWEDVIWKGWQNHELCAPWVEQYRLPVIILSCTLLESVINFYICTKSDAKLFDKLDRKSLFQKWVEVPKELSVPTYSLTPDIASDLKRLTQRRNTIVPSQTLHQHRRRQSPHGKRAIDCCG